MFKDYSFWAIQVIMVALRKAGQRGAVALEIDDLLVAIIVADQGGAAQAIFDEPSQGARSTPLNPPRRFLAPEVAGDLLAQIESLRTKSEPIANNPELPISEGLKRTLSAASSLREEMHRKKVEPLHLLAAALEDESSTAAQIFYRAGVTRDSVLKALKEEAAFRERPLIAAGTRDTAAVPAYSS
ncbi:MAG TPA: Clp protease N-terminal domain-containing protein [Terriglobia bacterium]|nr:Clp protease N-terminal domain-containing protein [Terriglobia bacterium]